MLPRADVHVRDGRIEAVGPNLTAAGAEMIDATDMIVMPGFVDTHYHMWSALGRNFVGDDGFGYFPAKAATSKLYTRRGLLQQRDRSVWPSCQRRHHHRAQLVAQHAHAGARRRRVARAPRIDAARPLCLRPRRPDAAQRAARLTPTSTACKREYFADGSAFEGLVTFGVNLRGLSQSDGRRIHADMKEALDRGLKVAIHAGQIGAQHARRRGLRKARLARTQFPDLPLHSRRATPTPRRWRAPRPRSASPRCRSCGWAAPATRARRCSDAQGRRADLAVVRRQLDRAAQHVRDHALHLEHGHARGRARRPRNCRRCGSAK